MSMSNRANVVTRRATAVLSSSFASRRFLFATVSVAAMVAGAQQVEARSLGGSASDISPAALAAAAAQSSSQAVAGAARQAQQSLDRTMSNMRAMQAVQAAAQAAAAARASGIPHGLQPGGLQAASGSGLWQGSLLPKEFEDAGRSKVTVVQTEQKSILTWQSFNISEKTDLYFDQRAGGADVKNWVSLNRVMDTSTAPSRIFGTISAEGQVYVINRNGIVFGAGSQVNAGALIASSLALSNEQFLRGINNPLYHYDQASNHYGIPQFGEHASGGNQGTLFTPGYVPGDVSVEAGATIKVENGGKLLLFAPKVVNAGHLAATDGQIILAAGEQVWLSNDMNGVRGLDVAVSAPASRLFNYGELGGALGIMTNYGGFTNFVRDSILPEMNARAAAVGYKVTNTGSIHADHGNITLQSLNVFQGGVLTASSALDNREGSIRLRAWGQGMLAYSSGLDFAQMASWSSGTVTLGANSVTAVLPDLTDTSEIEQAVLATRYRPGNVQLRGNLINIESLASVMVPSGTISVVASKLPIGEVNQPFKGPSDTPVAGELSEKDGSRIYIDSDAYLTVAGIKDIIVPMARNFVQAELYINELRDSPLYRDSWLRGLKVIVDRRVSGTFDSGPMSGVEWITGKPGQWVGSPLADFSAWLGVGKTDLGELSTKGGAIILKAGGSVITRAGSLLDVSGGSVRYTDGINTTTKLLGYDGRIYNIGDATDDMVYVGLPGRFTRNHERWGVIETWNSVFDRGQSQFERGYAEGRDGGSIQVYGGEALILDGGYWGGVIAGEQQISNGKMAKAGTLKIGAGSDPDRPWTPSELIVSDADHLLPADFNAHSAVTADYYRPGTWPLPEKTTWLSAKTLSASGLGKLDLFVTSSFTLEEGTVLTLDPGASLSVTSNTSLSIGGTTFDIDGTIRIAGGTVSLGTGGAGLRTMNFGSRALIDVSGQWVNEIIGGPSQQAPKINGGEINLSSMTIKVDPGATLDVSGGGWVTEQAGKAKLKTGDAGKIVLPPIAGDQMANFDLRAFAAGSGGSLELDSITPVQIGGATPVDPAILHVSSSLYADRGFRSVKIRAFGDIIVPDGALVAQLPVALDVSGTDYRNVASGARITDVGQLRVLQPEQRFARKPSEISLQAVDADIIIGVGATLRADLGGRITLETNRTANIRGTIDAPAGAISIAAVDKLQLDAGARLLARGAPLIYLDSRRLRIGDVKPGGAITLESTGLQLEVGSLIDVSGASGWIDLRGGGFGFSRRSSAVQLVSNGGSITIKGNGVIAGALMGHPGGPGALGGRLIIDHAENSGSGGPTPGEVLLSQIVWLDPTCLYTPVCENNPQNVIGIDIGQIFEDFGYGPMPTMILTQELLDALSAKARSEFLLSENGPAGRPGGALNPLRFGLTAEALDAFRDNVFYSEFLREALAAPPMDSVLVLRPSAIANGRFADLDLSSNDALKLDGVSLTAGRVITLAGPLSNFATANSSLRAPTIQITGGNATASAFVAGRLSLEAHLVDIVDVATVRGFAQTHLETTDLRLSTTPPSFVGQPIGTATLDVEGDLSLKAAQIYPASGTRAVIKTAGTIVVTRNGDAPAPLSAGGSLTLQARVIAQNGVLRAPFGEIVLKATERVVLGGDSITSVSGLGLVVPYGHLSNDEHWIDPTKGIDNQNPAASYLAAPPEKRLTIDAPSIDVGAGSTIDVRGGGDLYAREFVPGPGGSHDILAMTGAYAVLPGYSGMTSGGSAGDSVYLAGGNGLAAGWYTLLPAGYAALPGAFLVTLTENARSTSAVASIQLADGSMLMGGRRANGLDGTYDQLSSIWRVMSGAQLRQYSEFNEAFANSYFASDAFKLTRYRLTAQEIVTPRLPMDGGAVVFKATQDLMLNGQLQSEAAAGGRGGLVDIAATKIAIVGSGKDASDLRANGYLLVDAGQLTSFGAGSLLIGGTRAGDARGLRLDVSASEIVMRNDGASVLAGPEIILAASGLIDIEAGSVVMARGTASADAGDLVVTPQIAASEAAGTPSRDYGALIRLSNAGPVSVIRENVDIQTGGVVRVGEGALLAGGQALLIDATRDTELAGSAGLSAVALSLASGQIGFGGGSQGLVLSTETLAQLASTQHLTLRSYTTIDFHRSISFGGAGLATVTLDAAGLVGVGGNDIAVTGKTIALQNSGRAMTGPAAAGSATLSLFADELVLGTGTKTFGGFGQVVLAAANQVVGEGNGRIDAGSSALTISTPLLTGRRGAAQSLATTGALSVVGDTSAAIADLQNSLGARISLSGGSVHVGGRIVALGGAVDVTSTSGDIALTTGSLIDVGGFAKQFFDVASYSDAGRIALTAVGGDIVMGNGAVMNLAAHADGGHAGSLAVIASGGGSVTLDGRISAQAAMGKGGGFTLDIAALPDFAGLSSRLNAAGFTGSRQFRVRNGDIVVDGLSQVGDFSIIADLGKVTVAGIVDARSVYGGRIAISAGNGVVMDHTAQLLAGATDVELGSGRVTLEASGGLLDLRGGTINVAGGEGGRVRLRARQRALDLQSDGHDEIAVLRVDTSIIGARSAVLEGVSVYDRTSVDAIDQAAMVGDANTFAARIGAIAARLGNGNVTLMPGIEIRSAGDLTLVSDWNLFTDFASLREGGLTLRAAGNLILKGHVSDGFDQADRSGVLQDTRSWDLRLVAGADLTSASALAMQSLAGFAAGSGNLVLGDATDGKLVRTGTGDIDIRAGRNIDLANNKSVIYTAGRRDTTTWSDFAAPFAGDDGITIDANFGIEGGHLNIGTQGNIVSAVAPRDPSLSNSADYQVFDWLHRRGAIDERLLFTNRNQTAWWVDYGSFQQGVGALGGGNVSVNAGGDLVNLLVALPTNGRVRGGRVAGEAALLEMRGGGAMNVTASGTIAGGQYYIARGAGTISAGELGVGRSVIATIINNNDGTISSREFTVAPVLALGDAHLEVRTSGNMEVQTVLDPLMIKQARPYDGPSKLRPMALMSGYTERTALDLVSIGGNVTLTNDGQALFGDTLVRDWNNPPDNLYADSMSSGINRYAAVTRITALNGSVDIAGPLAIMPARQAELRILADRDIRLVDRNAPFLTISPYPYTRIMMSRATPEMIPTPLRPYAYVDMNLIIANDQGGPAASVWYNAGIYEKYLKSVSNPDRLPMADDHEPSRFYARNGSIIGETGLGEAGYKVTTNEQTWFRAGTNIRGFSYSLRNNHSTDVSLLEAGNDIIGAVGRYAGSIRIEGPGSLMLAAGRDIFGGTGKDGFNFATSISIRSEGNRRWDGNNRPVLMSDINGLPEEGASVTLMAGLNGKQPAYADFSAAYLDPANVAAMPDYLRTTLNDGTVVPLYLIDHMKKDDTGQIRTARRGLVSFMEEITGEALAPLHAWERFQALPQLTQQIFLRRVYMQELRDAGRDQLEPGQNGLPLNGGYNRGYAAITTLFPGDGWKGDIVSGSLTIRTMGGGDIETLTPGGGLQVAALSTDVPAGAGLVTLSSGHINIFAKEDVIVNRSRILTFVPEVTRRGSDMIIWSTVGDVDAGRGAKTLRVPSAPDIVTDEDGVTRILERVDMSGSGIGTIGDGDVTLVAPRGTVNFGDAGVRVARDFYVAADRVLNATNIDLGGAAKGLPPVPKEVPAIARTENDNKAATDAAKTSSQTTTSQAPSVIIVEVLGYGGGDSETDRQREEERKRYNQNRQSYDPNAPVQVVGHGNLTADQMALLTSGERARKLQQQ
jgi:filamentous hemagglutinin family protein